MQEHLTRLKAASATVTALVNRAEQAPDQTALDAALYEIGGTDGYQTEGSEEPGA